MTKKKAAHSWATNMSDAFFATIKLKSKLSSSAEKRAQTLKSTSVVVRCAEPQNKEKKRNQKTRKTDRPAEITCKGTLCYREANKCQKCWWNLRRQILKHSAFTSIMTNKMNWMDRYTCLIWLLICVVSKTDVSFSAIKTHTSVQQR